MLDTFTPLTKLPLYDGFYLDTRPKGERKVMNPAWKPKNGGHPLRFEIADKKDLILVTNFFNLHFTNNNNLRQAIGATYQEMEQYSYDLVVKALEKPVSWLVFEDKKLVAFGLQTYYTFQEFSNLFKRELNFFNQNFEIKNDYAEVIKNGPYNNLNANRIATIHDECFSQIQKFLPNDVKNLAFGMALGVHPNYMRTGLAEKIMYENMKDWKNFNCKYSVCYCNALSSYEAAKKIGMKELFNFLYKDYKENGKSVFGNLPDGAKACYVMLADTIEITKAMDKRKKSKI